ncbi:hypothetical protein GCM10009727_59970 [Actinomadura napierensis]|uniref:Uncharacterized protein n=1 Tax=Actinomadura napierensis TaxID=267854 RepID=A0ABN3A453_9ACTN
MAADARGGVDGAEPGSLADSAAAVVVADSSVASFALLVSLLTRLTLGEIPLRDTLYC